MDVLELKRLRPIIRAFANNVNQNWNALNGEDACDRYHELYDMVQAASGDPDFKRYVQPIMYWGSVPKGARLSRKHAVEILNSASQLFAYLDSAIGSEEVSMDSGPHSNQPQQVYIRLGDNSPIIGNVVVAHSVESSFNKAESADISNHLKDLLQSLAKEIAKISVTLPEETAEQVARDLETLTTEATSKTPRKQWLQLSIEGLKKAAENVGAIGEPVLKLVALIVPLLKL